MIKKTLPVINKYGLHARAANKFVALSSTFGSSIKVSKDGQEADGKSIMGIMILAAAYGSDITLEIDGKDEELAMQKLEQLLEDKFGEPE